MISNPEPVRFLSTIRGENGFGFFRYAYDIAFPENWHPLKQIFSLARQMGCTVLLEEEGKPNELGQAEIEQLRSLKPGRPKLQRSITRVSFYTLPVDLARQFKSDFETARGRVSKDLARFKAWYSDTTRNSAVPPENSCLGYLILYKDYHHGYLTFSYIPEAVIKAPPAGRYGQYVHAKAPVPFQPIPDCKFVIDGSYFSQQEGSLWCCAHAAIITSLKNMFAAMGEACPIDYRKINEWLAIDHKSRFASHGITASEIHGILNELNLNPMLLGDRGTRETADAVIQSAYYQIEPGLPAMIVFSGQQEGHVMAVVGHTFDENLRSARAQGAYFHTETQPYLPSHGWVGKLIVQDDNFGPYCSLPRSALWERNPVVVAPRFRGSNSLSPQVAEWRTAEILTKPFRRADSYIISIFRSGNYPQGEGAFWFDEFVRSVAEKQFVLRATPIDCDTHLNHLQNPLPKRKSAPITIHASLQRRTPRFVRRLNMFFPGAPAGWSRLACQSCTSAISGS